MPSTYAFSKPTYGIAIDANPFGVTFYVSNTTNPTEDQGSPGPTAQGRTPKNPFTTAAAVQAACVAGRGDTVIFQRGTYSVTDFAMDKAGVTYRAAMNEETGVPDHVVISGEVYVTASGVTVRDLEFFSNSADEGSVSVGIDSAGAFSEVDHFTSTHCSYASDGTTEPEYGLRIFGGNNHTIVRNRFVDNTRALCLRSGSDSFVSGVTIEDNVFLENTTYDLGTGGPTPAVATGDTLGRDGGVANAVIRRNAFAGGAVIPTAFVNIVGGSSGLMEDNAFASATNAVATIIVPAGILYSANKTEAGSSTARPA